MFIYKITNTVNGKTYIGQTIQVSVSKRINKHISELNRNIHSNKHLQSAWIKYGESNFKFEVIDQVAFSFGLDNLERFWIKHYDSTNPSKGYNKESGGNKNKIKSKQTIEKHKIALKKWHLSEEGKAFMQRLTSIQSGRPSSKKGKPVPKEVGNKISLAKSKQQVLATHTVTGQTQIYQTTRDAAASTKSSRGGVWQVCSGRRNSCHGWIFSYVEKVGG